MKNIAHLCSLKRSPMWGSDGWKKVVVCIVADGRKVVNKRVLNVLASMGVYQAGIAKNVVDDKPVKAHIYEVRQNILFWRNKCITIHVVYDTNIHRSKYEYKRIR